MTHQVAAWREDQGSRLAEGSEGTWVSGEIATPPIKLQGRTLVNHSVLFRAAPTIRPSQARGLNEYTRSGISGPSSVSFFCPPRVASRNSIPMITKTR